MVIHYNVNGQTCFVYRRELWRLQIYDYKLPVFIGAIAAFFEMLLYY